VGTKSSELLLTILRRGIICTPTCPWAASIQLLGADNVSSYDLTYQATEKFDPVYYANRCFIGGVCWSFSTPSPPRDFRLAPVEVLYVSDPNAGDVRHISYGRLGAKETSGGSFGAAPSPLVRLLLVAQDVGKYGWSAKFARHREKMKQGDKSIVDGMSCRSYEYREGSLANSTYFLTSGKPERVVRLVTEFYDEADGTLRTKRDIDIQYENIGNGVVLPRSVTRVWDQILQGQMQVIKTDTIELTNWEHLPQRAPSRGPLPPVGFTVRAPDDAP